MISNSPPARSRWQAVKMATAFISPYKRQVLYSLFALLFTAAITLSIGQGIRLLIDRGFATSSTDLLTQYVAIFLLLVFALAMGTFMRYYWVTWLG
jgi:ATP-binding cassette subfamily B protein